MLFCLEAFSVVGAYHSGGHFCVSILCIYRVGRGPRPDRRVGGRFFFLCISIEQSGSVWHGTQSLAFSLSSVWKGTLISDLHCLSYWAAFCWGVERTDQTLKGLLTGLKQGAQSSFS